MKNKRNGCPLSEECEEPDRSFHFCVLCRLSAIFEIMDEERKGDKS